MVANALTAPHLRPRREKVFGEGRPRALDRNAKVRIMARARALKVKTKKGKHYGAITAKDCDVLEALLWLFHNCKTGLCFPSYKSIAAKAKCSRSHVGAAIKRLEAAGLLTWLNRLKRVRAAGAVRFGGDGVTLTILDEKIAKWALENLRKGDPIYAECRVAERSYQKDGQTVYTTDIIANIVDRLAPSQQADDQ